MRRGSRGNRTRWDIRGAEFAGKHVTADAVLSRQIVEIGMPADVLRAVGRKRAPRPDEPR